MAASSAEQEIRGRSVFRLSYLIEHWGPFWEPKMNHNSGDVT